MGSMHPVIFFVFVYVVALLLSVFIFSSLFYSCNAKSAKSLTVQAEQSSPLASVAPVMQKR